MWDEQLSINTYRLMVVFVGKWLIASKKNTKCTWKPWYQSDESELQIKLRNPIRDVRYRVHQLFNHLESHLRLLRSNGRNRRCMLEVSNYRLFNTQALSVHVPIREQINTCRASLNAPSRSVTLNLVLSLRLFLQTMNIHPTLTNHTWVLAQLQVKRKQLDWHKRTSLSFC